MNINEYFKSDNNLCLSIQMRSFTFNQNMYLENAFNISIKTIHFIHLVD